MTEAKPVSQTNPLDEKLQAEIEDALGDMSLADMLDMPATPPARSGPARHPTRPGARAPRGSAPAARERRMGMVVAVGRDMVHVEFGPKSQGMCPIAQFKESPAVGDHIEFIIERFDAGEGLHILSRPGSVAKAAWDSLDVGQVIEARCTAVNKGGLEMEVAQHKAFMPAGQVDLRHIEDLSIFVGEKMTCRVMEIDRARHRMLLSRRAALEAERVVQREKLLEKLEVGNQLEAVITSVQPFGAFADIGGADGLIHISDLSHARLRHPSEVVKLGDRVRVQVMKIDTSFDPPKIGLGMKQCTADPYQAQAAELVTGATVTGRVTKIMAFGAFVELAPGVEGLIHISELSHERVHSVSRVVKPDEIVTVKVLSVDPASRRISLSLKALKVEREESEPRGEDARMKKLRTQLSQKFGNLKGGIG